MDDLWTKSWQTWQHASQGLGLVLGLSLHLWPRPLTLTFDLWPDWWSIWTKSDGKIDTRPQQKPFGHTMSACTQKIDLCIDETGTGTNTMVEYEPKKPPKWAHHGRFGDKIKKKLATCITCLRVRVWPLTLNCVLGLDLWPWHLALTFDPWQDKTRQDTRRDTRHKTRPDLKKIVTLQRSNNKTPSEY